MKTGKERRQRACHASAPKSDVMHRYHVQHAYVGPTGFRQTFGNVPARKHTKITPSDPRQTSPEDSTVRLHYTSNQQSGDEQQIVDSSGGLCAPGSLSNGNDDTTDLQSDCEPQQEPASSPEVTQSRLILNNKGENLYIGEIASLSFLQFLRRTLRYQMGASTFTEAKSRNLMLEVENVDHSLSTTPELDSADIDAITDCFRDATSGILNLFTLDELESHANDYATVNNDYHPERLLAIAIGLQCRDKPWDLSHATRCFSEAQRQAFDDMLCNPSISMVKTFLLMSFYMLGACRRNAAFMYLGVAAKAACALGLHSNDYYQNLHIDQRHLRENVWKSLFVLDTIVSAVLGRPSSLPEQTPRDFRAASSDPDHERLALDASYEACIHLRSLIQQSPSNNATRIMHIESFLGRLRSWSQGLHSDLRQFMSDAANRRTLIGNTHVACIYYFTVMLATRPFLISHLISRMQEPRNIVIMPSEADREKISRLAETCLDAAVDLSQLCYTVLQQGGFLGNMRLIKAFIFAAGLLIGFHLFAKDNIDAEVQAAFDHAQAVLRHLSYQSPQAKHYHEILQDFAEAIIRHQQRKLKRKRRATSQYLDHIFDPALIRSTISTDNAQRQYLSPIPSVSHTSVTGSSGRNTSFEATDTFPDFDFDAMMEMYDPGNLPLIWDDFG
ncbi:hypothetical protein H2198_000976 [Neophaeococcomyces mojaviensis]|uniref:Uncharacterized protein n=1 Tax=Neophaeococcomyces mojaviensis TaxID=3383035 RepID=A0ACC3AJ11_9EURO|nr:hypothetical protein H2198_000976 [Knufia sp. JES_112]